MELKKTALNKIHHELGGKMVPFAGYEMPIQYKTGIVEEHKLVRNSCGLFDVSHMGQIVIEGLMAGKFLSTITPTNFDQAEEGSCKYTVLTNENGGIIDDLIITRLDKTKFFSVINAGCAEKDIAWIRSKLPADIALTHLNTRSLMALQGPRAEEILQPLTDINLANLGYMKVATGHILDSYDVLITRSGYTGEDGFELSVEGHVAEKVWNALTLEGKAQPAGLGCRDSLRLEMGYPLYGHDIDDKTSPVEAGLSWVMTKEHAGFVGSPTILNQKAAGVPKKRIGLVINEKIVAREGAEIYKNGNKVGVITSGGFSPSLNIPIAMGYVAKEFGAEGETLSVMVRGKEYPASVKKFPLVAAKTKKA
jgi:aminomethyltransferase